MILINAERLDDFKADHADAAESLDAWEKTVEQAVWKHLLAVRRNYPSADGVKVENGPIVVVFTVFNIKGNHYRLITRINYEMQTVWVKSLLTHAEYGKQKWKHV